MASRGELWAGSSFRRILADVPFVQKKRFHTTRDLCSTISNRGPNGPQTHRGHSLRCTLRVCGHLARDLFSGSKFLRPPALRCKNWELLLGVEA